MDVLVTGAKGQLGQEIKKISLNNQFSVEYKFLYTDVYSEPGTDELDITDLSSVRSYVKNNKINFVINCAAYTAVDKAESEPQKAELINKTGPSNLANVCSEFDIPLIHISTDFVFDGQKKKPYVETDTPNPLSVYGKTKLEGEQEIVKLAKTFIIIRTSWLYSEFGNNFVKTILRLAKEKKELKIVSDQIGTPTYAQDLASVILDIIPKIKNGTKEIFNYSNDGVASWYNFASAIINIKNISCNVISIQTKDYPTVAVRPAYSVLDKTKIKRTFDIKIPEWQDSLKRCLARL